MSETLKKQIVDRIDQRMKKLGLRPRVVGIQSGFGPDLVRDWRRSKALPRIDSLMQVAPVLKTSPQWLAFGAGDPDGRDVITDMRRVPLISWVAASDFQDVHHVAHPGDTDYVSVGGLPDGEYIALEVKGDSMDRIAPDKSQIIVRLTERDLLPRLFYVFVHHGSATFKRYMQEPDRLEPFSTNPNHEALPVTEGTEVLGRVTRVILNI